jgi:hypothetical protein
MKFWKELFPWKHGGGWECEGCYGLTFSHFSCFGLLLGTLKWDDFVPTNFKCPTSKRCVKNQFPGSLATLTDVYPTQQGKAYNFGFEVY